MPDQITRYADMFTALGAEPRLRIVRTLLSAHPEGLVVGAIQKELGIPGSTLSHHLERLENEGLLNKKRQGTYLRYTANAEALRDLLSFLFAECCSRSNAAVRAEDVLACCSVTQEARCEF